MPSLIRGGLRNVRNEGQNPHLLKRILIPEMASFPTTPSDLPGLFPSLDKHGLFHLWRERGVSGNDDMKAQGDE